MKCIAAILWGLVASAPAVTAPAVMAQAVMAQAAKSRASPQTVLRKFALGGTGGWDDLSIDPGQHRLYLSRSDRVVVMDTLTGKKVGEVTGTDGVHGIALAPNKHWGFTSNGKADTVTVFDLNTLATLATIKVTGSNPDAIVYDQASGHVITFNGQGNNATVIDAAKRKVVGTIALGGKPEFARVDGYGRLFVNIEDKGELAEIDTRTNTLLSSWSIAGCDEPSGLAFDGNQRRVFSACANGKLAVTDADSGKHIADIPIGAGPDGAAFDEATGLLFVPNGKDGTLTVAHEDDADHYKVIATISTQKSARTTVLDPSTHRLYLPAAEFDPLPAGAPPNTRPPIKPDSFVVLEIGASDHR